jgi:hypothetical protein
MVLAFFEKWLDGCPHSRVAELRTFCIMLRNGIAQFVGSWVSESGYHLRIKKVDKDRALVDFLDPRAAPVQRPYMGGAPSLKMVAHYDSNGIFEVDLWQEGKGFILDLTHEYDYELDPERREALVPALSRNEGDHFLDACYSLFGPLDHFVRRKAENKRLYAKQPPHRAVNRLRKPEHPQ